MTATHRAHGRGWLAALVAVVLVGAATVGSGPSVAATVRPAGHRHRASEASRGVEQPRDIVQLLPLSTSSDLRIVDSAGRDVLLRGANLNSLGEYWQGDPTVLPTIPVTDADWASMAAHGFSVVRLLISWSRVEPTRGHIDQGYLDTVDAAVKAAAAHGIYAVIDMHQDAYTSTVFTTDPAACPAGTVPAKGWDGAPAWATITDGKSTCDGPGGRNDSPAILAAWDHFYENTDGIRDEFVKTWLAIARRFAGRPEVAGYDLLNEPETSMPSATLTPLYDAMLKQIVLGIRSTEKAAGASFGHLIFVEPTLPSAIFSNGLVIPDPKQAGVDPTDIVAAAHNYSESIGIPGLSLTIEGTNNLIQSLSKARGVPDWTGEYGFFSTDAATLAKVARYARDEDRLAWGGAWWQWRQSCGDPHGVSWVGDQVLAQTNPSIQLNGLACPGNTDLGPTTAYLKVVGRAYPRATPGRITSLASDPATGRFTLDAATLVAGGQLVVWTPSAADASHVVEVEGLDHVVEHTVAGGRLVTATVTCPGTYTLRIGPAVPMPATPPCPPPTAAGSTSTTAPGPSGEAAPAQAVSGTSDFTG